MKKVISLFVSLILVLGIVLVLRNQKTAPVKVNPTTQQITQNTINIQDTTQYSSTPSTSSVDTSPSSNVTVKDGIQYITIDVKRGYSPQTTTAK